MKTRFRFKPVEQGERSLIHTWLKQPYIAEWFYGQGLENTIKHLDEFFNGTSYAEYWLGLDKDRPFAFLITSYVRKPQDAYSKWSSVTGTTLTLDMLIGDTQYLGKGLATQIIHEFLSSQFPNVEEVLIDPEATNTRAIHVYEKAGFKKLDEFIPSHSPNPHFMMKMTLNKE